MIRYGCAIRQFLQTVKRSPLLTKAISTPFRANGGKATQLTTHPAHDTRPIWSPDGSKIAFASDRNGNFDIFIMDMEGGSPKQLTTHSANEYPETFSDAKHILYSAAIQQDAKDSQFPSGQFHKSTGSVSMEGAPNSILPSPWKA